MKAEDGEFATVTSAARRVPLCFRFSRDAAWCSAGLYSLLLVVYGSCNQVTACRAHVGCLRFAWEDGIPYVPAMTVPYLSMNLFFLAAPFVCADHHERRAYSWRMVAAILIAAACFLLFPLRNDFVRPHLTGPWGTIIEALMSFDMPYNMLPSLHIVFIVVLADTFGRYSAGVWRLVLLTCLFLSAISTLLIKQHYVVDIFAGILLGVILVRAIRVRTEP